MAHSRSGSSLNIRRALLLLLVAPDLHETLTFVSGSSFRTLDVCGDDRFDPRHLATHAL